MLGVKHGGITKSDRAHVRFELKCRDDVKSAPDGAPNPLLTVKDPLPPLCPVHGVPEIERVRTWVTTSRKVRHTRGQIRILGTEAGAQASTWRARAQHVPRHISFDVPMCAHCVRVDRVARWAIKLFLFAGLFCLLAVVNMAITGLGREHPGVATLLVFGAILVPTPAIFVRQMRQGWWGFEAPIDGSALVVAYAHPNFVVETERRRGR